MAGPDTGMRAAGKAAYWLHSASLEESLECAGCLYQPAFDNVTINTEPLRLAFRVQPPASVQTDTVCIPVQRRQHALLLPASAALRARPAAVQPPACPRLKAPAGDWQPLKRAL